MNSIATIMPLSWYYWLERSPRLNFYCLVPLGGRTLGGIAKYYWLEVQLACLVHFAQLLRQVASHLTYSALQISLTLIFSRIRSHFFFFLVMYLQPVGSEGAYKYYWLEVQLVYLIDFAQFLLRFARHFTFLYCNLVFHSLESIFTRV